MRLQSMCGVVLASALVLAGACGETNAGEGGGDQELAQFMEPCSRDADCDSALFCPMAGHFAGLCTMQCEDHGICEAFGGSDGQCESGICGIRCGVVGPCNSGSYCAFRNSIQQRDNFGWCAAR